MVVAQVTNIRNVSKRTFYVQAGDILYHHVLVNGQEVNNGLVEAKPGCELQVDGLAIPWASLTRAGLVVREADGNVELRCVVGPKPAEEDSKDDAAAAAAADDDFLRLHTAEWEPVMPELWRRIGSRHRLGAVGHARDFCMLISEQDFLASPVPASSPAETALELAKLVSFAPSDMIAPMDTVFLNVYDLAGALSVPNALLCNTMVSTFGAFHAALQVYGEEWAFYRTPRPQACGVCRSVKPRHHTVHVYRQSINLGRTMLRDYEVRYLVGSKLARNWPGGSYHLLERNCIHFCQELSLALGVRPVPSWVRGLHETGASLFRIPWPLSLFMGSSTDEDAEKKALAHEQQAGKAAGDAQLSDSQSTSSSTPADPGAAPPEAEFLNISTGLELDSGSSDSDESSVQSTTPGNHFLASGNIVLDKKDDAAVAH
eukprot:TRINITY_DN4616_c0_g1_i1.p1 TRINITY_DN4616_c0_g1~~TRINITY_DN4616_c0_g1_i1.p1  ORF type:complete len:430 (+),score=96.64 TRINITY_DN4616_c0_g1_i1:126-1415(+)